MLQKLGDAPYTVQQLGLDEKSDLQLRTRSDWCSAHSRVPTTSEFSAGSEVRDARVTHRVEFKNSLNAAIWTALGDFNARSASTSGTNTVCA